KGPVAGGPYGGFPCLPHDRLRPGVGSAVPAALPAHHAPAAGPAGRDAGVRAAGHILIEDLPGLGKTLLARAFATVLGLEFTRVQFTPDMLPADLTGATVLDLATGEAVFRPGPVFTGLLLADEINRTPPKTQAALLEAMAEGQVSTDGVTRPLPPPFVVLATDNPIEYEGTYPLPEAQLDRFMARVSLGYLDAEGEGEMVRRRLAR